MAASASSISKVQQLYVAYYGRAGDPAGVDFWATTLDANGGNVSEMINQFGNSDEYTNGIGTGSVTEQVTSLYQQMFNRAPETAGLEFWVSEISSGKRTLGEVAVAIAESALSDDATILANKVTVAEHFTAQISTTGASYEASNITEVQAIILSVTTESSSVTSAMSSSDTYMTNNSGAIFTLTSSLSASEFINYPENDNLSPDNFHEQENGELISITGQPDFSDGTSSIDSNFL